MSDKYCVPSLLVGCASCLLFIKVLINFSEIEDVGYHDLPEWNHCHEYVDHDDLSFIDVSQLFKGVVNILEALDCVDDFSQIARLINSRIACIVLKFSQSL